MPRRKETFGGSEVNDTVMKSEHQEPEQEHEHEPEQEHEREQDHEEDQDREEDPEKSVEVKQEGEKDGKSKKSSSSSKKKKEKEKTSGNSSGGKAEEGATDGGVKKKDGVKRKKNQRKNILHQIREEMDRSHMSAFRRLPMERIIREIAQKYETVRFGKTAIDILIRLADEFSVDFMAKVQYVAKSHGRVTIMDRDIISVLKMNERWQEMFYEYIKEKEADEKSTKWRELGLDREKILRRFGLIRD